MGLSCFSRPAVVADDDTPHTAKQSGVPAGAVRDAFSVRQKQQQLSPVRSGLSAAAAAAAMPALDLSSAGAAGSMA